MVVDVPVVLPVTVAIVVVVVVVMVAKVLVVMPFTVLKHQQPAKSICKIAP